MKHKLHMIQVEYLWDSTLLTQVTDVLSELLEGVSQAFGVSLDFGSIHHEGHTMDFVFKTWSLHVFCGVHDHWLNWVKLE